MAIQASQTVDGDVYMTSQEVFLSHHIHVFLQTPMEVNIDILQGKVVHSLHVLLDCLLQLEQVVNVRSVEIFNTCQILAINVLD